MSEVSVRSQALHAALAHLDAVAESLRREAAAVLGALAEAAGDLARGGSAGWAAPGGWAGPAGWAWAHAEVLRVVGPAGLWGESVETEMLASRLRLAARAYEQVERGVEALLAGVASGVDLAAGVGWFVDGGARPQVRLVPSRTRCSAIDGVGGLVRLGGDLEEGRVRVVEVASAGGGSSWVVVIPGTQEWSPQAGRNPFDVTTDIRAVTGEPVVAAAGVVAALDLARATSGRATLDDQVVLVGHSQGGILAASLASDPGFGRRYHLTHVVTTGAPIGLFPVLEQVRVLSVEHTDDPVPALDLTPNPSRPSWRTLRGGPDVPVPLELARHRREVYEHTVSVAADAPRGTVPVVDAWEASAGAFLGRPVRSVTEVEVSRTVAPHPPES